jgi:hypothetical protein
MTPAERIYQYVRRLPDRLQVEVLGFVEYLLARAEYDDTRQDETAWANLSLSFAMRDIEDEQGLEYSLADVKETFSRDVRVRSRSSGFLNRSIR